MKNLIFSLFAACFLFVTGHAMTANNMVNTKISKPVVTNTESVKIKVSSKNEAAAYISGLKEKKASETNFQLCFIYIMDAYLSEAMNGDLYLNLELEIHCYGVPGVNDLTFVIDKTQEPTPQQ